LVFTGCDKDKKEESKEKKGTIIYYSGCGIVNKAFLEKLAKEYEKDTGIYVSVSGGGATKGIRDAAGNKVQIGGTCRHSIGAAEEKDAKLNIVAWDALAVIVHKNNPIKNISEADLKKVLIGQITNWKQLGGQNKPIQVLARKGKISGVGLMVRELIFGNANTEFSPKAARYSYTGPLEEAVEKIENAIAITGISSGRKRDLKIIAINKMEPTYQNIASGSYPYFRPLYLATNVNASKEAQDFITYAVSDKGQAIIKKEDIITLADGKGLMEKYQKRMSTLGISNWK
jgi:phosphate transport system substrate-binding protein